MENSEKSGLEAVNKSRKNFSDTQIYRSICILLADYMKIYMQMEKSLIKIKLDGMGVLLHPKKHYMQHYSKGVQFIGGIIKPNRTYISNRTKNNFYTSVRKFGMYAESNNLEIDEIQYIFNSINSYLGFLKHHKTYNIRHKALFSYWMYCLSKWMMPNKNYNKVEFLII